MNNLSFRSIVCSIAYAIQLATGKDFGVSNKEAMRQAWKIYRLKKRMRQGQVTFAYRKTDGSIRLAIGTLQNIDGLIKGTGKFKPNSVPYFDCEKNSFRSFKPEELLAVES